MKFIEVIEFFRLELIAKGVSTGLIFRHHAPADKDHVLISIADQSPDRKDGLINFFTDLLQVTVNRSGSISDMLALLTTIKGVIGTHSFIVGSPFVRISLNRSSPPYRRTSQQWEWVGLFEVIGEL